MLSQTPEWQRIAGEEVVLSVHALPTLRLRNLAARPPSCKRPAHAPPLLPRPPPPLQISPVSATVDGLSSSFTLVVQPWSVNVLQLDLGVAPGSLLGGGGGGGIDGGGSSAMMAAE